MITLWTGYFVIAGAVILLFLVGGWPARRRRHRNRQQAALHGLPRSEVNILDAPYGDVAIAAHLALDRLASLVIRNFVRIDLAIPPELKVRLRGAVLIDLLQEMLSAAIHGAPASRLLLTASLQGDHIEITVTDDMPNADQAFRLGQVRGLVERAALLGGTLRVTAHATEGTTIAARLLAAPGMPHPSTIGLPLPPVQPPLAADFDRRAEASQLR